MRAVKASPGDFEVAVLSGLHAGACARPGIRSHTVIGRDIACDLMLRDDSVADRHLMLVLLDGKVSAVELDGSVEIDGLALPKGKTAALRNGVKIRLGNVLLGVGAPGTDWSQQEAFTRISRSARMRIFIQRWLSHSQRRRRGVKIFVFVLASACVVTSLLFPIYQWSQQKRLQEASPEVLAKQLGTRLAPMRLADVNISVDQANGNVIVGGYVPLNEDLRRIELVILATKIRPFMRLFSTERIVIETKEYLKRHLPEAHVTLEAADTVRLVFTDPLQPTFRTWLQAQMLRDIPGLRKVLFNGPSDSAVTEVAPQPFSILSNGPQRFLVDADGGRFFPGSELSKGVYLKWVGIKTVAVERRERVLN